MAAEVKITLGFYGTEPVRGSPGSSGYDLTAPRNYSIEPGRIIVVHSDVSIELPDATWEGQVRGRSSMNKRGLVVISGTIDSDYRGVIGATILNTTTDRQDIKHGERFAQLVFARVEHPTLVHVTELSPSVRGTGGFGSTGR